MNAAAAAAFDRQCLSSSQALWPGEVNLGDGNLSASVLVGAGEEVIAADGRQATESLTVEISTDLLETAPAVGTMIEDVATGSRYEIYRVLREPSRWLIRAAKFPA